MKKTILFGLIFSILAIADIAFASELYGTVWEGGRPAPGAGIRANTGEETRTDNNGYYSINMRQGNHTLTITLTGGRNKECDVYVYPQGTEKTLYMEKCR